MEQAYEWLLRLEEDASLETRRAFLEWCEQSREHVQAFLEITVLDRQLNGVDPQGMIDMPTLIAECQQLSGLNVIALNRSAPTQVPHVPPERRRRWAWAAGLAGITLACTCAFFSHFSDSSAYQTRTGEQRSVKLEDGSVIYLNTHSQIKIHYSRNVRNIDLIDGEAYFVVAQDLHRSFFVRAGSATVQALGTQFNVYRESARTTVAVVEGRVQLATGALPVALAAGEIAQVTPARRIEKEAHAELGHATAWRQRQLDFRRASLFEVVAQFNRYNTLQLKIADREVGERLLNGVFDADAPEQLLAFLAQRHDLRFERNGSSVVIRTQP